MKRNSVNERSNHRIGSGRRPTLSAMDSTCSSAVGPECLTDTGSSRGTTIGRHRLMIRSVKARPGEEGQSSGDPNECSSFHLDKSGGAGESEDSPVCVISDKPNGSGLLCNQSHATNCGGALASGAPVANNTSTLAVLSGQAHKNSTSGSIASVSLEQGPLAPVARSQEQVAAVSSHRDAAQSASSNGDQSVADHRSEVQQVGIESAAHTQGHALPPPLEKRLRRKRDPSPPLPNKTARGDYGLILDKEDEDEGEDTEDGESGESSMDLEEDEDLLPQHGSSDKGDSSSDDEDPGAAELTAKLAATYKEIHQTYEKFRWELRKGNIAHARYQKYVDEGKIPQDLNFKVKMANPFPQWFKQYCPTRSLDDLKAAEDAILTQAKHAIVQLRFQKMTEFISLHQRQCDEFFTRDNILNELMHSSGVSDFPRSIIRKLDDAIRETKAQMDGLFADLDELYRERLAKRSATKPPKPNHEEREREKGTESSAPPPSPPPPPPPEPTLDWPSADLTADEKIEFLFTNGQKQFLSIRKKLEKLDELDAIKQCLADIQKNLPAPREFGRSQPVRPNNMGRQATTKRNPPSKQHSNDHPPANKHTKHRSYSEAARQAAPERQPSRQNNTSHRTVHIQHRPDDNNRRPPQRQNFNGRERGSAVPPSKPHAVPPAVAQSSGKQPSTRKPPPAQPTEDWQEVRHKKNNRKPPTQNQNPNRKLNQSHPLTLDRKSRVALQRARK